VTAAAEKELTLGPDFGRAAATATATAAAAAAAAEA